MTKRISIDELAVGMFVAGIDQPWMETPFFRHRMTITDQSQIERLRAGGVKAVDVQDAAPAASREITQDDFIFSGPEMPVHHEEPPPGDHTPPPPFHAVAVDSVSFEDELPQARRVYHEAKGLVQRALTDARLGKAIDAEMVGRVVDGLADSVLRNAQALTSLSRIKSFDEYTFFHSVNTAVLALALGRSLGMERDGLHLLGMGALLHDVGKMMVPLEILNKPGRLLEREFEVMKQHALRGAEILTATPGLREDATRPALEHHERINGTGYPFGLAEDAISLFGRISSVVDVYDAMTSDRVYHKAMASHQALQFLYDLSLKGHLDQSIVERFIRCVGVYPVGSCVSLSTGEIGLVTRTDPDAPLAPAVLIVRDAEARPLRPYRFDLADQGTGPVKRILATHAFHEIGIDPSAYLDAEQPEPERVRC